MNLTNRTIFIKKFKVILNKNFDIINVLVEINLNSKAIKYKRIKQV